MALDCSKIPQCFHSDTHPFVGVKGCAQAVSCPSSGYWINELPGFTISAGAKTTDNEHISNAIDFYKECIRFAIRGIATDLINSLPDNINFRFNNVTYVETIGKYSASYLPISASNRGLRITKNQFKASFIRLTSLEFLANSTATITVTITDGAFVTTKTADIVAGQIAVINLDYTCDSDTVYVTVDNTALSVNNSSIHYSGCGCSSGNSNSKLQVNGWNGSSTDNRSYGMRLQAGLICDPWALLCGIKGLLGELVLLKAGIRVLEERLWGDRINAKTLPKEQINEAILRYKDDYSAKLSGLVKTLPKLLNSGTFKECITCQGGKTVLIRA